MHTLHRLFLFLLPRLGLLCLMAVFVACGGAGQDSRPVAEFTALQVQTMTPLVVELRAEASTDADGSIVEYRWDLGDGSQAMGQLYNHVYSLEGEYDITLTVTDTEGNSASATQRLLVVRENSSPRLDLNLSVTEGTAPLMVEFTSNSRDVDGKINEVHWDFGDGNTALGETVSHRFDIAGDYVVRVVALDNEGGITEAEARVVVYQPGSRFTIAGEITALPYTDVDGDVNDLNADYFNNDGHPIGNIQAISNPVMLNGYLTRLESTEVTDAFAYDTDVIDFYAVDLQQGDYVSLKIVDSSEGDIDLNLYRASDFSLVASSMSNSAFEVVQAPDADRFVIVVQVVDRYSRYLMRVGESPLITNAHRRMQSMDFVPGEAIIKLTENRSSFYGSYSSVDQAQLKLAHRNNRRPSLAKIDINNTQTKQKLNLQTVQSDFDKYLSQKNPVAFEKLQTLRAIKTIKTKLDVALAEPNYRVKSFLIPDDPSYIYQWHYPAIGLPSAWDITLGSPEVVTAVVDSGVYSAHQDLTTQLLPGFDFISDIGVANDGDGIDADPSDPGDSSFIGFSSWHGTHVAGTVAAAMGNGAGGVGVAPDSLILPLRTLGRGGGSTYDMQQALRYAAGLENDSGVILDKPVDIINLSLGGSGFLQSSQDLFNQLRELGIIVIAAAGNENTDEALYPASYDNVVSVAAVGFNGERASYSNYGAFIDVAAPGGELSEDSNNDGFADGVLSTAVIETETERDGGYFFYHGTSMAAPHVAGVAALMKTVNPDLSPEQFDSLLASGVMTSDRGEPGRDNLYGHGLIDAALAVQAAIDLSNGGTTSAIIADRYVLAFDHEQSEGTVSLRQIGSGGLDIVDVQTTEEWINVVGHGIGVYQVSVERGAREDGNYRGFINFTTSAGQVILVQVNMRIGDFMAIGDAGFLYVLLFDVNLGVVVAVDQVAPSEGKYHYRFDHVPAAEYFIAAGSDINNDGLICEEGESCGFYPSISEFETIMVGEDKLNLDFTAGLFSLLSAENSDARGMQLRRE